MVSQVVLAQATEPIMTQFYNSPLQVNPANAGLFAGRARVISNFKRQWESIGQPFQTISVSTDFQVIRDLTGADFLGMGIDINQDQTGTSALTNLSANLSLSYTKAMDRRKTHFMSVGFQGGYGQRSISTAGLNWGSQWTRTGFEQGISTPDQALDEATSYFDLGTGVNYFYSQKDDNLKIYLGVAAYHLLEPKISFLGNDDEIIGRKFNVSSGLKYQFGRASNFYIFPNALFSWQGKSRVMIYGADIEYRVNSGSRSTGTRKYTSFAAGLYHKWSQTITPVVKLHKAGFSLCMSYDFEMGNLTRVSNGQGGIEVALMYRIGFRDGKSSRNINNAFF